MTPSEIQFKNGKEVMRSYNISDMTEREKLNMLSGSGYLGNLLDICCLFYFPPFGLILHYYMNKKPNQKR